ncbi:hypothetical protein HHI36_001815, partial [Cryptolaemus montrouzieri]
EIERLLDVKIAQSDICDVYTLGRSDNSPVKIELLSYLKKKNILSNTRKLKDTSIVIAHDLTLQQRDEQKSLRVHMKRIKQSSKSKCFIKGKRLHVDNTSYCLSELESPANLYNGRDSENKKKSESTTPSAFNLTPVIGEGSSRTIVSETDSESVSKGNLKSTRSQK